MTVRSLGRPIYPLEERALLAEVARALVGNPVYVRVEEKTKDDNSVVLALYVLPRDRGRVIGRRGKTISAIRQLFSAIGVLDGRTVLVELDDSD